MRPILTDELLNYLGELFQPIYNNYTTYKTFQQFVEEWLASKEGWMKSHV